MGIGEIGCLVTWWVWCDLVSLGMTWYSWRLACFGFENFFPSCPLVTIRWVCLAGSIMVGSWGEVGDVVDRLGWRMGLHWGLGVVVLVLLGDNAMEWGEEFEEEGLTMGKSEWGIWVIVSQGVEAYDMKEVFSLTNDLLIKGKTFSSNWTWWAI